MKKNKGITLIALIVTIVIIIILAGISIDFIVGDDGVISRTKKTRLENLKIQILNEIENEIIVSVNDFGEFDLEKAIENITKNLDEIKIIEIVAQKDGRLGITVEEKDNEFKYFVSNKGEVILVSEYIYERENLELSDIGNVKVYDFLAPIPTEFVVSKIEDENKIKDGLVIYEKNGIDKYIWIPVSEEDLNSILVTNNDGDLYYHETIKIGGKEKYKIVEPYYVSAENVNINGLDLNSEQFNMLLRKKINETIGSIKNNGGFYISKDRINLGNVNWLNYWIIQNNLKDKYNGNEKIDTAMIYSFQVEMIKKFLEEYIPNNLEYLKSSSAVTQSALLGLEGENLEFKYANLSFGASYENINSQNLQNGTYTVLYFK